jgi:hypothetical protein
MSLDTVHDADRHKGDLALAELRRLAGAPFADRVRVGVVQADQPGRAFGCLPGRVRACATILPARSIVTATLAAPAPAISAPAR